LYYWLIHIVQGLGNSIKIEAHGAQSVPQMTLQHKESQKEMGIS
jgi:hypothetical protein